MDFHFRSGKMAKGQGLSIRYRYPAAGYIIGSLSNDHGNGYENVS